MTGYTARQVCRTQLPLSSCWYSLLGTSKGSSNRRWASPLSLDPDDFGFLRPLLRFVISTFGLNAIAIPMKLINIQRTSKCKFRKIFKFLSGPEDVPPATQPPTD